MGSIVNLPIYLYHKEYTSRMILLPNNYSQFWNNKTQLPFDVILDGLKTGAGTDDHLEMIIF